MYRNLLVAIACIGSLSIQAQDSNNIHSDNTGFTMSPQTVGKKALQVEAGYSYFSGTYKFQPPQQTPGTSDIINYRNDANLGGLKLRYGIFDRIEVSGSYGFMTLNYRTEFMTEEPRTGKHNENYLALGVKGQILKGTGLIPSVGVSIDYRHGPYSVERTSVNLAAENRLFEKMGLRINLGYTYQDFTHIAAQINYLITDHWKVFGEYSGNFGDSYGVFDSPEDLSYYQPENITGGVVWNINPNTLFGLSGSYFLNKAESSLLLPYDKAQSLAVNISFNKRFDWGK